MLTPKAILTPHLGAGRTLSFKSGVSKLGRRWGGRPRHRRRFRHEIVSILAAWFLVVLFFVMLVFALSACASPHPRSLL